MTSEGTSTATPVPCVHPRQFRWQDGRVVGQELCAWCGPGYDLADPALKTPAAGPANTGPMETGWHEDATGPYLSALQELRRAASRETDRVQVGKMPGEELLAVLHTVHAERANYLRAVAAALGGPIPAAEVDAVPLPSDRCADGHLYLKPGCAACSEHLTAVTGIPVSKT